VPTPYKTPPKPVVIAFASRYLLTSIEAAMVVAAKPAVENSIPAFIPFFAAFYEAIFSFYKSASLNLSFAA